MGGRKCRCLLYDGTRAHAHTEFLRSQYLSEGLFGKIIFPLLDGPSSSKFAFVAHLICTGLSVKIALDNDFCDLTIRALLLYSDHPRGLGKNSGCLLVPLGEQVQFQRTLSYTCRDSCSRICSPRPDLNETRKARAKMQECVLGVPEYRLHRAT